MAVHARDAKGEDLTEVRLTIDGETVAERLDGRALTLDPGTHTFRFNFVRSGSGAATIHNAPRFAIFGAYR